MCEIFRYKKTPSGVFFSVLPYKYLYLTHNRIMEFKEIPSAPGYSISREGVVKGTRDNVLSEHTTYKTGGIVTVRVNKKRKQRSVRSLLAETWFIDAWKDQLESDEQWKEVNGFPDYVITSKGRVWSKKTNAWIHPWNRKNTYYWMIDLCRNGSRTTCNVHILVGRHFLDDYRDGLCILHIDENLSFPEINYVDNFRVGTHAQNMADKIQKGRRVLKSMGV